VRRVRDATDRRKVLVEMTELGWQQTNAYYVPLAQEGARMLEQYTDAQLTAMRDHLIAATALIDRHRARIRGDGNNP
jgi:DNA-binding MarR family transcriptional regulator